MLRRSVVALPLAALAAKKNPVILLRSSWQTVNIGDIAHTPGVLAVLRRHLPNARVILWPGSVDRGVAPMLRKNFPKLEIVEGPLKADGTVDAPDVAAAFREADFFLHGSAASAGSYRHVAAWSKATDKPYGFFGVGFTTGGEAAGTALTPLLREVLDRAAFTFTRETHSLVNLRAANTGGNRTAFVPDGTFSCDLRDDAAALPFLKENGLEPGRFMVAIPRLRLTPYHKIRAVEWTPEEIRRREETNERNGEPDHAKMREAIVAYVRKTGGRVLLAPEMTYELDVIDPLLYDPLPADVKPSVARRKTYWLTDEAASVYRRAALVISFECHSPILSAVQGTPCMYLRQPEDGLKGQMWRDVGLGDWYIDNIETATGGAIAERVVEIATNAAASRRKARAAVETAQRLHAEGARTLKSILGA